MGKRFECITCFGTGRAGMLSRHASDCVWRSNNTCPTCGGRGYIGNPSLRRRIAEWLDAPEKISKSANTIESKPINLDMLNYTISAGESCSAANSTDNFPNTTFSIS